MLHSYKDKMSYSCFHSNQEDMNIHTGDLCNLGYSYINLLWYHMAGFYNIHIFFDSLCHTILVGMRHHILIPQILAHNDMHRSHDHIHICLNTGTSEYIRIHRNQLDILVHNVVLYTQDHTDIHLLYDHTAGYYTDNKMYSQVHMFLDHIFQNK